MAVTFTAEKVQTFSTANATTYDTAAFTPTANSLLIMCYSGVDSATTFSLSTITETVGTDLTWNVVATGTERNDGTTWNNWGMRYCIVPATIVETTVRLTWSEGVTGCHIWIGEFSNYNMTAPITQSNATTLASGTETHSLGGAVNAASMTVYMNTTFRTPPAWDASGDGWTEMADAGTATPNHGMFVAYKANDQTIAFTGTNIAAGSVIAEIGPGTWQILTNIGNVALTTTVDTPVVTAAAILTDKGDVSSTTTVDTPVTAAGATTVSGDVASVVDIPIPIVIATETDPDASVSLTDIQLSTTVDTPVTAAGASPTPSEIAVTLTIDTPVVTAGSVLVLTDVAASLVIDTPVVDVIILVSLTDVAGTTSIATPVAAAASSADLDVVSAEASVPTAAVMLGTSTTLSTVGATLEVFSPGIEIFRPGIQDPFKVRGHRPRLEAVRHGLIQRGRPVRLPPP